MSVPVIERVNVQLALNAYAESADRFEVIGLQSDIGNYGGVSLPGMLTGAWHGPGEAARQYVAVDVDVDETIDCLRSDLVLTDADGSPVVALV